MLERCGQVVPTSRHREALSPGWTFLDLADGASLDRVLEDQDPDLVVNAGAYTAVDRAEDEPELAHAVNADAPARLGAWANSRDRAVLHFSTDYVFAGDGDRPWREDDPTGPLSVYGASKLAGEQALAASGCRHLVLRSAWIYAAHGNNFVLKMLELARAGRALAVVGDQVGSPTWTGNLARYAVAAIRAGWLDRPAAGLAGAAPARRNVYHAADSGTVSWYAFADLLFDEAVRLGLLPKRPELREIGSAEFPQRARRPSWSVLDSSALLRDLGVEQGELRASLRACLEELVSET